MKRLLPLLLALILASCAKKDYQYRQTINLQGSWKFALDTADVGIRQHWYATNLQDTVRLPGTTDTNHKGFRNTDTTTNHLNRVYKYVGAAWYQKEVDIPQDFQGKHIRLSLERTKVSKVWVDSTLVGGSIILQSPQRFDVSQELTPGKHTITVRIDNRTKLTPYGGAHIYAEDTQTNWNGIIGDLKVVAMPRTYISDLQVYPDIRQNKIDVELGIKNGMDLDEASIKLIVDKTVNGQSQRLKTKTIQKSLEPKMKLSYDLGDTTSLWDEYNQPLYKLTAVISSSEAKDSKTVPFGMRSFTADSAHFKINGRTTFLRGKHEAAVFPETGYTPTDVASWERVFRIAKSYGINHYRFHTYTPPEAAFTAADRVGIYLQAELPFWGGLDSDSVATMLRAEGKAMLDEYANHPSFVMFSHGNELWSGLDRAAQDIKILKAYDHRPLYTTGSNNQIGYAGPQDVDDFYVGARTPSDGDTTRTHLRLTHAFVDSWHGGILNTRTPSTDFDYSYPISQIDIPVVSHEIGQYQIYPDYNEIDKYTGVLRARNLEVFRDRLKKAGMLDQDSLFQKASGAWSALCYKAEMEAALRTGGLAGFQLLDLQDFPGQGTALVGILDAFMDPKGVMSRKKWLQSNNDVTLLLEFPKYTWTNDETFHARTTVANYSNQVVEGGLHWSIKTEDGQTLREGTLAQSPIEYGGLTDAGEIKADLSDIRQATKLNVHIATADGSYTNDYPIWVYPPAHQVTQTGNIMVAQHLNQKVRVNLQQGGKVLLFPRAKDIKGNSVGGLFPPNFWNYEMFKNISQSNNKPWSPGTLGLLMDPGHPLFNHFPTDFHTNWQWFSIIKHSNPLILDQTANDYRPIVQVIDNLQRNHKLGLIFEFKMGEGKLLVCMSRLDTLTDKPEAVQLYQSILDYMDSGAFEPRYEIGWDELKGMM